MTLLYILAPIGLAALLSVAGWLIKRNEAQHDSAAEKIDELRVGQAEIKGKLNLLIDLIKRNSTKAGL